MIARAVLGVVLTLAVLGCEGAVASPGAICTRRSDCVAPLVCRVGRCRTECDADHDCPSGARCFLSTTGGACELPALDLCNVVGACPAPLVCRASRCAEPCSQSVECGGGACAAGTCALAPTGSDAGVPASPFPACTTDADCSGGDVCASAQTASTLCRPTCATDVDCAQRVGPRSRCWRGQVDSAAATICSLPCALGEMGACGPSGACIVEELYPLNVFRLVGVAECGPVGPGQQGDSCSVGCADGLVCGPTFTCTTLCRDPLGASGPCPTGTRCQPYSFTIGETGPLIVDGVEWGVCT